MAKGTATRPPKATPQSPTRLADRIKAKIGNFRPFKSVLDGMAPEQQEMLIDTLREYVKGTFGPISSRIMAHHICAEGLPITRCQVETLVDKIKGGVL